MQLVKLKTHNLHKYWQPRNNIALLSRLLPSPPPKKRRKIIQSEEKTLKNSESDYAWIIQSKKFPTSLSRRTPWTPNESTNSFTFYVYLMMLFMPLKSHVHPTALADISYFRGRDVQRHMQWTMICSINRTDLQMQSLCSFLHWIGNRWKFLFQVVKQIMVLN